MFDHVMLDIETLGNSKTAAIASIGAVRFDLQTLALGKEFYRVVDVESSTNQGLTIDASTVKWWMQQSPEAMKIFNQQGRVDLPAALRQFAQFINEELDTKVWGHGSTFDNVIVQNAYKACGMKCPWSYKNDMCFRTMLKMFPQTYLNEGVAHNALDDARRQAKSMIEIWRKINNA